MSPLQKSVEEAARNNEKLIVQELVTAINLAQSSYGKTEYKSFVPARGRDKCTIELKDGIVKVIFIDSTTKNTVFAHYLLTKTPVEIADKKTEVDCRTGFIKIEKRGGQVIVG
ncbi:MAG: hypothetical protein HY514_00400 [Candidatus Aenigmarchaeota archaeon]|nr:hypothetical protein [Candidatus Aenigmarchaeota archaeon]